MQFNMGVRAIAFFALSLLAVNAFGQSLDSGDTAWMSMSTALVLFMTVPGLALFYGGMVHANSVVSVLMQCFAVTCLVTILWLIAGYTLAFGSSVTVAGDLSKALYAGVGEEVLWGTIPESIFATFHLTFAIITSALIVGTLVERIRFSAVLLFTAFWTLLVYSPVAHWVWGGGWLGELGVLDFAGGLVVHVTAGTASLVAVLVLGPRHGFPGRIPPFVGPAGALAIAIGALSGALCLLAAEWQSWGKRSGSTIRWMSSPCTWSAASWAPSILAGVFASSGLGLFSGQEDISISGQLRVQIIGVVAVMIYTGAATSVILALVNAMVRNRVSQRIVADGLDRSSHDELGYRLHSERSSEKSAESRAGTGRQLRNGAN